MRFHLLPSSSTCNHHQWNNTPHNKPSNCYVSAKLYSLTCLRLVQTFPEALGGHDQCCISPVLRWCHKPGPLDSIHIFGRFHQWLVLRKWCTYLKPKLFGFPHHEFLGGPGWTSIVKKASFCVHFTTKPASFEHRKSQWPSQVGSDSIWLMLQGLPRPSTSESVWRSLNHTRTSSAPGPASRLPTGQSQLPAEIHRLDVMKRQWSDCGSNPQIMYGP